MKRSNLLISLTDMVSYSKTKKLKNPYNGLKKGKKGPKKPYLSKLHKKFRAGCGGGGIIVLLTAVKSTFYYSPTPLPLLRPPGKNLCINKQAKHSLSVMKKQCISVKANGKYTCRHI